MKYYNEKNYLGKNPKFDKQMEIEKEKIQRKHQFEREHYQDVILEYQEFIRIVSHYLQQLELKNSLEYSLAIAYLIRNGFLSEEEYKPKETNKEISICYGLSIPFGRGCCRNFATFHHDVMRQMNFPMKKFYCFKSDFPFFYHHARANHMIEMIEYQNTRYGIDLYCGNRLYHFVTPFLLDEISSFDYTRLCYKPYMELLLEESTLEEINNFIRGLAHEREKNWVYPMKYEDEIIPQTTTYLDHRKSDLGEIKEETKSLRKKIIRDFELIKKETRE